MGDFARPALENATWRHQKPIFHARPTHEITSLHHQKPIFLARPTHENTSLHHQKPHFRAQPGLKNPSFARVSTTLGSVAALWQPVAGQDPPKTNRGAAEARKSRGFPVGRGGVGSVVPILVIVLVLGSFRPPRQRPDLPLTTPPETANTQRRRPCPSISKARPRLRSPADGPRPRPAPSPKAERSSSLWPPPCAGVRAPWLVGTLRR